MSTPDYYPSYKKDGRLELSFLDREYLSNVLAYVCEGLHDRRLYGSTRGTRDTEHVWIAHMCHRVRPNLTFVDVVKQDVNRIDDPYVILAAVYFLLRLPIGVPSFRTSSDIFSLLYLPSHLQEVRIQDPKSLTPSFTPLEESIRSCLASADHMNLALYDLALGLGSKAMTDLQYFGPVATNPSEQKLYFESQRLALQYFDYDLTIPEESFKDLLELLFPFRPTGVPFNAHHNISGKLELSGTDRIAKNNELLASLRPLPGIPGEDEDLSERFIAQAADKLFVVLAASEKDSSSSDGDSPATTCSPHSVSSTTAIKSPKDASYLFITNPDLETPETRTPSSSGSQTTLATSASSSSSLAGDPEFFKAANAFSEVFVLVADAKMEVAMQNTKTLSFWDKCMDLLIPLYAFVDHMCISD